MFLANILYTFCFVNIISASITYQITCFIWDEDFEFVQSYAIIFLWTKKHWYALGIYQWGVHYSISRKVELFSDTLEIEWRENIRRLICIRHGIMAHHINAMPGPSKSFRYIYIIRISTNRMGFSIKWKASDLAIFHIIRWKMVIGYGYIDGIFVTNQFRFPWYIYYCWMGRFQD